MALTYEYRYYPDGQWIEAESWPTISLPDRAAGVMYGFQTRSKDEAGIPSEPTKPFYVTMPYRRAMLAMEIEGVLTAIATEDGDAIEVLYGENLYGRA